MLPLRGIQRKSFKELISAYLPLAKLSLPFKGRVGVGMG